MGFLGFDSSPRGHNSTPSFHSVLNFIYIYICMNISSVFDGMEKKKGISHSPIVGPLRESDMSHHIRIQE